jgi:hypothetical protein
MKNIYSLFIAITCLTIVAYGQKDYKSGYVITAIQDTIYGLINLKSNYQNCRFCEFLKKGETKSVVYKPEDIKAYRIEDNNFYVSKEIELDSTKKKVFLEFLVHGIANLYYFKEQGSSDFFIESKGNMTRLSNDEKIILGADGNRYFTKTNQYISALKIAFSDRPSLGDKIDHTYFDYSSLIRITKDYHNSVCKDSTCIDYTKSIRGKILLEPYAGMINSWMGLKTSSEQDYNLKSYAGLNFRFIPAKNHVLWNILLGINYSVNNFHQDYHNTIYEPSGQFHHVDLSFSIIRVPIILEYSFAVKKIQPFVSLGYHNIFILNPQYKILLKQEVGPGYNVSSRYEKYKAGVALGLGLRYKRANSSYFFLKQETEFRYPGANIGWFLDYTRVTTSLLSIGYGFPVK